MPTNKRSIFNGNKYKESTSLRVYLTNPVFTKFLPLLYINKSNCFEF